MKSGRLIIVKLSVTGDLFMAMEDYKVQAPTTSDDLDCYAN